MTRLLLEEFGYVSDEQHLQKTESKSKDGNKREMKCSRI